MKWLCRIGFHDWERLVDVFAFSRVWKHRKCRRCDEEDYV